MVKISIFYFLFSAAGPGQGLVGDEMQAWNPPEFNRDSPVGSSGVRLIRKARFFC